MLDECVSGSFPAVKHARNLGVGGSHTHSWLGHFWHTLSDDGVRRDPSDSGSLLVRTTANAI
eukprot:1896225-Amphidinium_carterae.2